MTFTFSPICNYCKYGKVMYKKIGKIYGSSEIWSDFIVIKKKTAEQFVYLNNHKQMYKDEQQFSISCVGSL